MRTHTGRRSRRLLSIAALTTAALLISGTIALATVNSMRISGPTSNKLGQDFNETITGNATGGANFVIAWEQYYKNAGCASTYAAESTRTYQGSRYETTLWLDSSVSGHYTRVAEFGAAHAGVHGMCAYLINLNTGVTFAHAGVWWNNHS